MLKKAKGLVTKGCRMTSIDKNDARCPHELCMKVKQKCKMTNEWRETDRQPQVGVFLLPRSVARPACPQPGTQTKKRNEEIYYSTHTVHTLQIPVRLKKGKFITYRFLQNHQFTQRRWYSAFTTSTFTVREIIIWAPADFISLSTYRKRTV